MSENRFETLRKKAEEILHLKGKALSIEFVNDVEKLIEELNIYHIELEMQNQELHETNLKLHAEQKRYKELYMNAPVAYFTLNNTGNIIELNQMAADMLQIPLHRFKYTSIFPYLADHSKIEFIRQFKSFFNSDKVEYGKIAFKTPNNQYVIGELSAICYNDTELNETFCRCTILDITEKEHYKSEVEHQRNLIENEKRNKIILDNLNDAVFMQDYETGRILSVNNAATQIYGYSEEEFSGMELSTLDKEEKYEGVWDRMSDMQTKGEIQFETKHITKNGNKITVEVKAKKINDLIFIAIARDISQRKEIEAKLRTERQQFLSILDAIPAPLYVADFESHKIIFANKANKKLYGDDMVGKKCFEVLFNLEKPCESCVNYELLAVPDKILQRETFNTKTDQHFLTIDKLIEIDNNIKTHFQISIDITELKQSQIEINQLNNRLEASLRAGNLAWWEIYLPSGKVKFNENMAKMLGFGSEKFNSYNDFMALVHPQDYAHTMKAMHDHLTGDKPNYDCEYRIMNNKGEYLWFHDMGKIIHKSENETILSGIVQNITERKKADKQKNYLSAIIENTQNICVIKDLDLRVIATNMSFVKAAGAQSVSDLIGKTDAEIFNVSPDVEPIKGYMQDEKLAQTLKKGEKIVREEIVIYPDKSSKTFLTTKFPVFDSNDHLISTANISIDITEQKLAEQTIKQQNDELVKLNADKDRFISILAHDLRNPFSAIIGFSELLLRNFKNYDAEKIDNQLSIIYSSANKTYNLLEELLLWSRSQAGKLPFEPIWINVNYTCIQITNTLIDSANAKNIKVNCIISDSVMIYADPNMFRTIMRNLVSNAIKFTNSNGKIFIYTKTHQKQVIITVEDNGVGIATENLDKLWKISEQYTSTGTIGESGTGLGLLLCKDFVEKHGGKIWVESTRGVGSKFSFSIPLEIIV